MFYNNTFSSIFIFLVILNLVNCDEDSPSVIIVGAGASGIAAASKLFQNGFKNITILEAQDRIGGRVFTTKFDNYWVDLGGQWVHGEVGNVAFELAWPLGLLEKRNLISRQNKIYDSSGTFLDQELGDEVKEFFMKTRQKISEDPENMKNISMGEFFKNEFEKYFETHPNCKRNAKGLFHMFDMIEMASEGANSWWNVSTRVEIEFHDSPGDYLINWKERGYSTILEILMKRYPNPEEELPIIKNTIFNAEVSQIDNKGSDGKVTVTTANGHTYIADHVIITASLGVMKEKYNTLFQPPLSEDKVKTIKALGFGGVAKIYFSFEEPWWPEDPIGTAFGLLWKDEDLAELEKDPERSWLQGLVGFCAVEHKPRLLYGWVSGKYSAEMEKLSDQQVFNHSVEVFQRFLGNSYNISTPTGMIRTMWNSNQFVRGTYSYRSVEADIENVWPATLEEPIGDKKPMILFAGEATHPHYFSTVHGAIASGWREADRLIELYPNLKSDASVTSAAS